MTADIRISGGTVIDPERGIYGPGEIAIKGNRIVASGKGAERVIDATGCLVVPGLIDFHAHLFPGGTELGVDPDLSLLPLGVTSAVDAGSCGSANYESFWRTMVPTSRMRIFGLLNVSPAGQVVAGCPEPVDPRCFDEAGSRALLERYRGQLLGLKIRISREIVGELGVEPLKAAVALAGRLNCPLVVHTTNPPVSAEELAAILRPGDVFCHAHHGTGETILDAAGRVRGGVIAAHEAGVVFDAANGRGNFSFEVARSAVSQGFFPDIISSDVAAQTLFGGFVFGLPWVMMKYLNLGMPLERVIAACTAVPARWMGLSGKIGTLAPGAWADVAIFRPARKPVRIADKFGNEMAGEQWLLPQLTICDGRIVFRQIDF
jgi:dihydroorotase